MFNNDGYWYRAEVVGLPTSDIAEVLYVDYGNIGKVSPTLVCQYYGIDFRWEKLPDNCVVYYML